MPTIPSFLTAHSVNVVVLYATTLPAQSNLLHLQELQNDPLGILRPASKLQHNLHLASAYAAVNDARDGGTALQKQKRRMDPKYREPKVSLP